VKQTAVDRWSGVRERLDEVARAIDGHSVRTADETRRILEDRARALARPIATTTDDKLDVLGFSLGGERFALQSRYVFEVFRLGHITLVPGAEPPLAGLTAWRGELLALLDLRTITGTSARALSDLHWVVVLGDEAPAFGILVDALGSVAPISVSSIRPPPAGIAGSRRYVRGITSEAVLVLDGADLISTHT
jgi:purine-binding chemotaxis protein CheW